MLGRTVAELEETLSAREFVEWLAYFRLEGAPAGSSWEKQMATMKLVGELQKARR